jgi:hypothetical protein
MTPLEKAKQLYKKYEFVYIQNYTSKFEVKQCCLIACDEMIDYIDSKGNGYYTLSEELKKDYEFWLNVKVEIELL